MKILHRIGILVAFAPLLLSAGCGSKAPKAKPIPLSQRDWLIHEPGEPVQGKLTYQGKPVPGGIMYFYNYKSDTPDGMLPVGTASIKDGSYQGTAPVGSVAVCVITDEEILKDPGPPPVAGFKGGTGLKGLKGEKRGPGELGVPRGLIGGNGPPRPKGVVLAEANMPKPLGADGKPVKRRVKPKELLELEEKIAMARKNPFGRTFSDEEKTMLKAIQEKYGTLMKETPLYLKIEQGGGTQDIDLK